MNTESPIPNSDAETSKPANAQPPSARVLTMPERRASTPTPLPQNGKRIAFKPKPGFSRNPLLALPRNEPCPCRSGKKFKACCLRTLPAVVPEGLAERYREQMARPDLVFVTHENQGQMAGELAERRASCPHDWEEITTPAAGSNPEVVHTVCKTCLIDKRLWQAALDAMPKEVPPA